jgi:hypothetical protein
MAGRTGRFGALGAFLGGCELFAMADEAPNAIPTKPTTKNHFLMEDTPC